MSSLAWLLRSHLAQTAPDINAQRACRVITGIAFHWQRDGHHERPSAINLAAMYVGRRARCSAPYFRILKKTRR